MNRRIPNGMSGGVGAEAGSRPGDLILELYSSSKIPKFANKITKR